MKYLFIFMTVYEVHCYRDDFNGYAFVENFYDRAAAEEYILNKDCYIEEREIEKDG